ncbi:DUF2191 domain-containing protein [Calidifontibacter sp. DB0510]|uniref:DUF2191 domain-containing protein n=1 Tax=Metallococcus carri TaxID=1656884 RepID=A0A967B4D0_9MICO|nr:DUF2191 domain-containing protein [Metallococcus carri]NHN57055.1 DUF2191 domain-containing protein [Metallococcus carri]NOP39076.1 DUF2191 domain-containing protein [Calidifontibacter sp. DB2511S]
MRTTLDLDDKVLAAARSLARSQGTSLGRAVSDLALRGLAGGGSSDGRALVNVSYASSPVLVGDPATVVTDEDVAAHRDPTCR